MHPKNLAVKNLLHTMVVVLFLCANAVQSSNALAGQPRRRSPAPTTSVAVTPTTRPAEVRREIRVFGLKHALAIVVAAVVDEVIDGEVRCVPQSEGNSLVVAAPPKLFHEIMDLIALLDQPRQEEERETVFIQLEYAEADELAEMLREILSDESIQLRVWGHTNSIVVCGSGAGIDRALSLIEKLDRNVVSSGQAGEIIEIFPLATKPDVELEGALELVLGDRGLFYVDTARNTVVVKADIRGAQRAQQIIEALDVPERKAAVTSASTQYRVRLVWLVNGLPREEFMPPPDDLKEVVDELAKISVTGLVLASQSVITASSQEFTMESTPMIVGTYRLRFEGRFLPGAEDPGSRQLSVRIEVDSEHTTSTTGGVGGSRTSTRTVPVCKLESTIAAPVGHSVVLGVTSMGQMTSVFVLQILPAD